MFLEWFFDDFDLLSKNQNQWGEMPDYMTVTRWYYIKILSNTPD